MSLVTAITIVLNITHTKAEALATLSDPVALSRQIALTDGDGANEADTLFHDQRTLADGANETLDLHDGSLADAFGDAVTLDILKVLYIKNNSADANLLIGGAAAAQLGLFADTSDVLKLPPGGQILLSAPDAAGIDCSTNAALKIAHDGTGSSSLTYDIIAVGVD
jgi:hypothetical protein